MKYLLIVLIFIFSHFSYCQNAEIENLINQIVKEEAPDNYKFYYLIDESLKPQKAYDTIQNYQKKELLNSDPSFPFELITLVNDEIIDWKKFNFEKIKFITKEFGSRSPELVKEVYFVKYNINQSKLDQLLKDRKPQTIYVRKKWFWSKKKIWDEVVKAYNEHENENIEEKIFFEFSNPIFSDDKKYARISISKNERCKGRGSTIIYKKDNSNWKKIIEYNEVRYVKSTSHIYCGDFLVSYKNP